MDRLIELSCQSFGAQREFELIKVRGELPCEVREREQHQREQTIRGPNKQHDRGHITTDRTEHEDPREIHELGVAVFRFFLEIRFAPEDKDLQVATNHKEVERDEEPDPDPIGVAFLTGHAVRACDIPAVAGEEIDECVSCAR